MSNTKYKNKHVASFEDKATRHIKHDFKLSTDDDIDVQDYLKMDIEDIKTSDVMGTNSFDEFVMGLKFQADNITSIASNVRYVKFLNDKIVVFNNDLEKVIEWPAIEFINNCYGVEASGVDRNACVGHSIKSLAELSTALKCENAVDMWWVTADDFVVMMNGETGKSVSILYDDLVCGLLTYESELLKYAAGLNSAGEQSIRDYVM